EESYNTIQNVISKIRKERRPFLVHAKVPLLNHHTSGVRMEFYRDDLEEARRRDPYPKLKKLMMEKGFSEKELKEIETEIQIEIKKDLEKAVRAEAPKPEDLFTHDFAPTELTEEIGERSPKGGEKVVLVDC